MGLSRLTAMSRPALAPCVCSAGPSSTRALAAQWRRPCTATEGVPSAGDRSLRRRRGCQACGPAARAPAAQRRRPSAATEEGVPSAGGCSSQRRRHKEEEGGEAAAQAATDGTTRHGCVVLAGADETARLNCKYMLSYAARYVKYPHIHCL